MKAPLGAMPSTAMITFSMMRVKASLTFDTVSKVASADAVTSAFSHILDLRLQGLELLFQVLAILGVCLPRRLLALRLRGRRERRKRFHCFLENLGVALDLLFHQLHRDLQVLRQRRVAQCLCHVFANLCLLLAK